MVKATLMAAIVMGMSWYNDNHHSADKYCQLSYDAVFYDWHWIGTIFTIHTFLYRERGRCNTPGGFKRQYGK